MRKIHWVMLAVVALSVLGSLAAALIHKADRVEIRIDVAKVEKDIRDHLPVGTPRAQIESYLNQRRIEHSYVERSPGSREYDRTEIAIIRDASQSWLVRGDIQLLFKFDEQGKLTNYSVQQIFTGP